MICASGSMRHDHTGENLESNLRRVTFTPILGVDMLDFINSLVIDPLLVAAGHFCDGGGMVDAHPNLV